MTTEDLIVTADIIEALETLMYGAVGMTAVALSAASAGELTLSQWRALVVIGRSDATRVGVIGASVGMSLPSASRLVRRLERRGLVSTERDEGDRRATLVRMTLAGRALRDDVVERRRALMEDALATHSPRLPGGLLPGLAAIGDAFGEYA